MKACFLDAETFGKDFSMETLLELPLDWTFYPKSTLEETLERLQGVEIVVTNKAKITRDMMRDAKNLKLICLSATGYDCVDTQSAKEFGIAVCNVPNYGTTSVVQLAIAFLLALHHNLIPYAEDVKKGKWEQSPLFTFLDYPISEVAGKVIGIVGWGNIGKKVGAVAEALGMKVLHTAHEGGLKLEDLLPKVDVLSLHVPLTPQTKNLITLKEFKKMKPSAFFINVSRGELVNEEDLTEALKNNIIAGAAIDVLSAEPPPPQHPLLQKDVPHLILTPHIAWAPIEARIRLIEILKNNISAFLGGNPQNIVV